MSLIARRLYEFAYPLYYPGSGTERLCVVGDSHASYINGSSERWFNGIIRTWNIRLTGWYTPAGSTLNSCIDSPNAARTITTLTIGSTQHPTDGVIAPHEIARHSWTGNEATDSLIRRADWSSEEQYIRNGNYLKNQACLARVHYWRRTNSLTTCRMRGGYTTDSYTTDSTRDLSGTQGYATIDLPIAAHASNLHRWDCFTGAEAENTKELTFIGHTYQAQDPSSGVILYSVGNAGLKAEDYASSTTVGDSTLWQNWSSAVTSGTGFSRIIIVIGTNMTAGESAAITTVWKANVLSMTRKILDAQKSIGRSGCMALLVTGHDANITSRLPDMATAMDEISASNNDIAFLDTAALLPEFPEYNVRWLADGVHTNNVGSQFLAGIVNSMLQRDLSPGYRAVAPRRFRV